MSRKVQKLEPISKETLEMIFNKYKPILRKEVINEKGNPEKNLSNVKIEQSQPIENFKEKPSEKFKT
jgi:hypothetical protein